MSFFIVFRKTIVQAFDLKSESTTNPFTDVRANAWYPQAVSTAQNLGLINGKANGSFGPREVMTNKDTAAVLECAAKLLGIAAIEKSSDSIIPREAVNRELAAEMIYQLMRVVSL